MPDPALTLPGLPVVGVGRVSLAVGQLGPRSWVGCTEPSCLLPLTLCLSQDGVMVLSATHRYKKKYVTTLLYKPI